MKGDRAKLYDDPQAYFDLDGNIVMKLTPAAAAAVCLTLASRGFIVARVEGGIWEDSQFEARYDCIWDGLDPPISTEGAELNNCAAARFIEAQSDVHGAFVLTAPPITGWPHLTGSKAK